MIEMIIAIAISSAIGGGILLSIYQTSSYQAMDRARMNCVKNLENAIHYIVQDAQMAQSIITPDADADGFPLEMSWTEWDVDSPEYVHYVKYSLPGNGELKREHRTNDKLGAETKYDVNVLASYIDSSDPTKTNCSYTDGVLSVTLTATITGFPKVISETRDMEIIPRTDW